MIGTTISHYKILEKLGEGGMGVVYKARDLKLDRLVALKFLPHTLSSSSEALKRFQQEAKAASALNHPNILTIYDFEEADGESFIAMELNEGDSLKSKIADTKSRSADIPVEAILKYSIQIAEGLSKAHEKGIVHRDIKSDNIMVTDDGRVKIMDFGLAKLRGTSTLTKSGSTVGTLAYMSPEQMQGVEADRRADIYSFGVVLYELVTGRLPFQGAHEAALMYEILNTDPALPSSLRANVKPELDHVILKCLGKKRESRYSSDEELLNDLKLLMSQASGGFQNSFPFARILKENFWKLLAGVAAFAILILGYALFFGNRGDAIDSIAMLPFQNVKADPDVEYLSDGITENLINSLSQVSTLRVVPRSVVFGYKGKEADAERVGVELKARAILTGRVIQRGDNLNVQAELIDVSKQSQLWGEQYNRKMTDIIVVQEEITRHISENLRLRLTGSENKRLTKRYTENTDAYQLYLKGNYLIQKSTPEGLAKGLELLKEAIKLDPRFAPPYAGLALYYGISTDFYLAPHEAMPEVKRAATKSLEIDNEFSTAHAWLGWYDLWYSWKWTSAKREFEKAIDLNPNEYLTHLLYSFYFLSQAQFPEAVNEGKRFLELEPLTAEENAWFGLVLYFSHQYDKAFEQLQKALEFDENFPFTRLFLGFCYLRQRKYPQALAEFQKAHQLFDAPWTLARLGYAHAMMGNKGEARKILSTLTAESKKKYVASDIVASMYVALGDKDHAFEYLDKGFEERAGWMIWLKVDPIWDPLRTDPRFNALLKRMDLDPSSSDSPATSTSIQTPNTVASPTWQNSIAVLPFKNISSDKEQEYFCDGMTEQLITNLTNLPNVKVIARTSVMQIKNTNKTVPQIAQELGVAHVLEGSVRKSGNKIRVTAQLIKADDGFHLWAKDYDRHLKDIFSVQDDVSSAIVQALKINLSGTQIAAITKRYTDNTEAYQLYLKGRYYWNKRTPNELKKGIEYFRQAIDSDPFYALAYTGESDSYQLLGIPLYGVLPPLEAMPKAKEAALKALEIDNTLAEAHTSLAHVKDQYDWDWASAETEYKRAMELNPNYATAHHWYSTYLTEMGRFDEGIAEVRRAELFDPLSQIINFNVGWVFYFARQYDKAIDQCRKALEIDQNLYLIHWLLGQNYLQKGMYEEAIAEFQKASDLTNSSPLQLAALAQAYAAAGKRADAQKILNELLALSRNKYFPPNLIALIYLGLNEKDQALAWLEKAYRERSMAMVFLNVEPMLDPLRPDPRFRALLKKMGFER